MADYTRAIELDPGYARALLQPRASLEKTGAKEAAIDDLVASARLGDKKAQKRLSSRRILW